MFKKSIAILCTLSLLISQCVLTNVSARADKTAPVIKAATPSNNKTGIATNIKISLKFSENIYKGKYFPKIKITKSGKSIKISSGISKNYLKIGHSSLLEYGTNYIISVPAGAIKDKSGNNLKKTVTLKFKTKAKPVDPNVKILNNALHDISISSKVKKDYENKLKPTAIQRSDYQYKAQIYYYPNGTLDYIKTDSNTLIAHSYSDAIIMCDYSICENSATALTTRSAIVAGTYDFTANNAGVKVLMTALSENRDLETFRSIANNLSVSADLLNKMKSSLGYNQFGAVIYGKSSKGILVGKYVFINPEWFNDSYPNGLYYCIDPENKTDFGKSFTTGYKTNYDRIP
ncbi:MAG: Ig-like domain-containing protein [Clostridia bacterium]|jgi:methionine-rich copper-binding protein CopC